MTIKKFWLILLLQAVAFTVLKFVFYGSSIYTQVDWQFLYWAVTAILTTMLVRRIGIMNYLEAIFTAMVWFFLDLAVDGLVTGQLAGEAMFTTAALWFGYFVMMVFVFAMHKKRHVAIRRGEWRDPRHH